MAEQTRLSDEMKRRIITELATFRTPPEIRTILREEYDHDMKVQDIIRYDATKDYCVAGEALKALFHATRREYVEGSTELYIANQTFRLRTLQRMVLEAEKQKNFRLAAALLEQAAKDFGGAFTNVRQVNSNARVVHLTPDEARREIEAFLSGEAQKRLAPPGEGGEPC